GCKNEDAFTTLVGQLVEAGVGMIQLRDKKLDDRDLVERAKRLATLTRDKPTLAIINDRADIAASASADGVHLGQEDLAPAAARKIIGPDRLIGISTHSIDQARQAVIDGANYLGAGPTFPSKTKKFDKFSGLEYLKEVATEITLPTFAIGGIDAENLDQVIEAGIERIALSGAVASSQEPGKLAENLLSKLK
ncbi:MAG: thiamine phosphate synthase, partial [Lacipirellulaceae bacterium]